MCKQLSARWLRGSPLCSACLRRPAVQQALKTGSLTPADLTACMSSLGKMMHSLADDLPKVRAQPAPVAATQGPALLPGVCGFTACSHLHHRQAAAS